VRLGALWFGFLAGPLAWAAQELVGYGLASRACGAPGPTLISIAPALGPGEMILSVTAIFLAVAGLATAAVSWRLATGKQSDGRETRDVGVERNVFMARAGMITGFFFLFGILMNAAGYFLVSPCG
jgi:hypothetical protein